MYIHICISVLQYSMYTSSTCAILCGWVMDPAAGGGSQKHAFGTLSLITVPAAQAARPVAAAILLGLILLLLLLIIIIIIVIVMVIVIIIVIVAVAILLGRTVEESMHGSFPIGFISNWARF